MTRRWAIVVVNFASSALLADHLVASTSLSGPDLVVVVDNFSTEAEREAVRRLCDVQGWTLVETPNNLGFGAGVNAGVQEARRHGVRDVLLLNPDARLGDETSARLLAEASRAAEGLSVMAPRIHDAKGALWFGGADVYLADGATRGWAKRYGHPDEDRWPWLTGACLWIPLEAWDLVGGFDDSYFLYWEDVDFSRRLVQAGVRLDVVTESVVVHDEGGTHGDRRAGRGKSSVYYYFNIRNRMLFAVHHLDAAGIRRWRSGIARSAKEILLRGGRRQFLRPVPPLWSAWRGIREARRLAADALRGSDRLPAPPDEYGYDPMRAQTREKP